MGRGLGSWQQQQQLLLSVCGEMSSKEWKVVGKGWWWP